MASGTRTRDWAEVDFYAILGVPADATENQIAAAYRSLAKRLHPDSGATAVQVEQFKEVAAANAVLSHPVQRRDYDRVRRQIESPVLGAAPYRPPPRSTPVPHPHRALSPKRARWVLVGGIVTMIAGVLVAVLTLTLRADDQAVRDDTVAVEARRVDGGVEFTTQTGEVIRAAAPDRQEAAGVGSFETVRYYPDDPRHVVADESRMGRDITLAIVALKLLVGGAVLVGLGARRLTTHN
jgi:hypothetical protein